MTDDHAIIEAEAVQISPSAPDHDLHPMVRLLAEKGDLTTETLERLMAMQERHDALTAERIFNDARARLLDDLPGIVPKNRKVNFGNTKYTYADLPQIMRSVMPALRKHGFSVSWTNGREQREEVVTCHLSHRGGHEATNTRRGSVESGKGRSAVQADQATVTYLQRHTLLALLGIVTDDMPDADETPPDPPRTDGVDVAANLALQTKLRRNGLSVDDAEAHVGAACRDWARWQYEAVRQWAIEAMESKGGDQ